MMNLMSETLSLNDLTDRLLAFRDARDWQKFHTPKNLAMSVSIEAAELLEIFQWEKEGAQLSSDQVTKVCDEVADILIYLMLLCDQTGVDLLKSASDKISRNETRFPIQNDRDTEGN